jgi:flagellar hook assembly protein FlgD
MLAPAPNPAHGGPVMLRLGLARAAPIVVRILDGSGRRVRSLADRMGVAGINALPWDGLDDAGHSVPPGLYFAAATSGTSRVSTRVLVLR